MQSESKPAVVATKPVSQPVAASGDREFLPAALEILETPPSPIRIWLLWFICGAFATAIIWAYFGKLDIHAVAHGKIQPTGRSKVVQPLEAGKVRAIRIENGSRVKAGDVLLELDPTDTMADRSAFERELEALTAEIARRRVGIAAAGLESPKPSPIPFPGKIDEVVRLREAKVLEAELSELASGVESLRAQRREKAAVKQRLDMSIQARERLIAVPAEVPQDASTAGFEPEAAVTQLLDGTAGLSVPTGVRSAIPSGTRLLDARISGDTVTLNFSEELAGVEANGLVFAIAQIVYTAAGITTDRPDGTYEVAIQIDGEDITVPDDEGVELNRPVRPSDYPTLRPVTTSVGN